MSTTYIYNAIQEAFGNLSMVKHHSTSVNELKPIIDLIKLYAYPHEPLKRDTRNAVWCCNENTGRIYYLTPADFKPIARAIFTTDHRQLPDNFTIGKVKGDYYEHVFDHSKTLHIDFDSKVQLVRHICQKTQFLLFEKIKISPMFCIFIFHFEMCDLCFVYRRLHTNVLL